MNFPSRKQNGGGGGRCTARMSEWACTVFEYFTELSVDIHENAIFVRGLDFRKTL